MRTEIGVINAADCCTPVARPGITAREAEALANLFSALGDASRVRIINLLVSSDEPICVCELTEPLGLSQGTVSFHLKKLLQAGLIEREQRGTWAYYSMKPDALDRLAGLISQEGVNA